MKILVVDDHPMFRVAIAHLVRQLDAEVVVLEAGGAEDALRAVEQNPDLDLALFDLNMPGENGLTLLARCRKLRANLRAVVVSGSESATDVQRALAAGARGYVMKSSPGATIVSALRSVLDGGSYVPSTAESQANTGAANSLTVRQMEVLALLCEGRSNKEVARSLNLAEQTVKVHVTAIFRALKVVNRTQAVLAARDLGFAQPA